MLRRFDASFADIGVRVLEIADEDREIVGHPARDIGVQVEGRDHRHVRPDDATNYLEQVPVGIVAAFGQGSAMAGDKHTVDRQGGPQAGGDLGQEAPEEALLDGTTRLGL